MPSKKIPKYYCASCGELLTEDNSFVSDTYNKVNPYCVYCQQSYFDKLSSVCGVHLAVYIACAKYDIPCNPLVFPLDFNSEEFLKTEDGENGIWIYYLRQIISTSIYGESQMIPTFFDGVTNILRIFGQFFTEKDFAKYVQIEQGKEGTKLQREKWGEEDNYTKEDYNALDRMYNSRIASFKGVTVTDQMEYILIEVAKWQLLADKRRRVGDIKRASDALKVVDNLLASESLRKKDEKPVEALRVDALVSALEAKGMMEEGKLLTYDELIMVMRDRFIKSKKYSYSLDAADQMIFDYYNNLRANADMDLVSVLPSDMELEDAYGEFEQEETEDEKKKKRYAGLTPVQFGGE